MSASVKGFALGAQAHWSQVASVVDRADCLVARVPNQFTVVIFCDVVLFECGSRADTFGLFDCRLVDVNLGDKSSVTGRMTSSFGSSSCLVLEIGWQPGSLLVDNLGR